MVSRGVLQTVAGDRPPEQPACVDKRLPSSFGVTTVDEIVDGGDDVGAADLGDRALAPAGDELAPDPRLNLGGGPLAGDVAGDEGLSHGTERARLGGDGDAHLLRLAGARIDAVLHLEQRGAGTLS